MLTLLPHRHEGSLCPKIPSCHTLLNHACQIPVSMWGGRDPLHRALASTSLSCAKANNSTSLLAFPGDTMGWDAGQASCHSDGLCVQSATGPAHTSHPGCLDWGRRHSPLSPPIPQGPSTQGSVMPSQGGEAFTKS